MIGQFLDKLDDKLYKDWQKHAISLSKQLKMGFDNIEFDSATHPELSSIKSSLEVLSNPDSLNRQDYVHHIRNIKDKLEILATQKEFDNVAFNNFIFQSRRSFNWLMILLFTDYNKYAEAALNPSAKEKKPPKSNFIKKVAINVGANYAVSNLHSIFEEHVSVYMRMQAEDIQRQPKILINDPIDFTQTTKPLSLIELKVGKERFAELDSALEIKQPEDVAQYLAEQIYGFMFKTMYSQIALQEETLAKIDKLSEVGKTQAQIKNERERLLHEAGLGEIDSPEAKAYRNKIAMLLGFNDSNDLFDNYQSLDTDSGFGTFKQLINAFMSNANKPIMAEDDPLENIKAEIEKENERIKKNLHKADYAKNSINYINIVTYNATNLMLTLTGAQVGKNIAQLAAKDFMDPRKLVGDNPGLMAQMAMKAADLAINRFNYKKYFDTYALAGLHNEGAILERRLKDINRPINQQWLIAMTKEIRDKYVKREQVIQNALSKELENDSFTAEYVDVMSQYKHALLEYNKIRHLPVHDPVFIDKLKQFQDKKDNYKNHKDAFSLFVNSKMSDLTSVQLDSYIERRNQKIKAASTKYESQVTAINVLSSEINNEAKRLKTTFKGRLQRFGEKVAGFFGIKTKSVKKREAKNKELVNLQSKLDPTGHEIYIQTELLNRAIEQKRMADQFQNLEVSELKDIVSELTQEYLTTYQMIQNDYEQLSITNNSENIFEHQQAFAEVQNKLKRTLLCLNSKIDDHISLDVPLQKLESFSKEITQAKSLVSQFDQTKIGLTNSGINKDLQTLQDKVNYQIVQKQKRAQEELLQDCKLKISQCFSQMSLDKLGDPYLYIETQDDISLQGLSQENRFAVYQHIQDECIHLLDKYESQAITSQMLQQHYKQAEQLFYQLRLGFYRVSNKSEQTPSDLNLEQHYEQLTSHLRKRLDALFNATNHLPYREQKNRVFELDSTFIQYLSEVEEISEQVSHTKENQASWLRNPFGWWYTNDTIAQLENAQAAKTDLLKSFTKHYTTALESYLEQSIHYFGALDYDELTNHIHHLQHQLTTLRRLENPELTKVIFLHEKLLEVAKSKEQTHVSHLTNAIQSKGLADLREQVKQLKTIAQNMNKSVVSDHDFDSEQYKSYQLLLANLTKQLSVIQDNISEVDSIFHANEKQYEALGKDLHSWKLMKQKIEADIISITCDMNMICKQFNSDFSFYNEIIKGNLPDLSLIPEQHTLGMGLLLAIKNNNKEVIDKMLKPPTLIDLQDLVSALKQAVDVNDVNTISKILALKQAISSDDIYHCIQSAFKNNNVKIAYHIILNTDFLPEPSQIDFLKDQVIESDAITGIDRGWLQLIVDTDGATILPDLRNWYLFQQQLIDTLNSELSILKEKGTRVQDEDDEKIQEIKFEINQFLIKLGKLYNMKDQTKMYLEHKMGREFKNDRVNNHFEKWNGEITSSMDALMSNSNKILDNLLSKKEPEPVTYFSAQIDTISELEQRVLEDDNDTLLQELTDKGVVLPVPEKVSISTVNPIEYAVKEIQEKAKKTSQDNVMLERAIHFNQAKSELSTLLKQLNFDEPSHIEQLDQILSTLSFNAPVDQPEILGNILSQSLTYLAKSNKATALPSLLDAIDEKHKMEYAGYALTQAIRSGSVYATRILLQSGAYKDHETELVDLLSSIYEERQNGATKPRHLRFSDLSFHVLTLISSNVTDPSTKTLDDKIEKMMDTIINTSIVSKFTPVKSTGLFGYFDADFAKLDKMRDAYLFAESAYSALSMNTYLTLQNAFDNLVTERQELLNLSDTEINQFEYLVNLYEANFSRQLLRIELLTGLYKMKYSQQNFDNDDRKQKYLNEWEKERLAQSKATFNGIKKEIDDMRRNIEQYHESKKQSESELQPKVKPLITSAQKISLPVKTESHEEKVVEKDKKSSFTSKP